MLKTPYSLLIVFSFICFNQLAIAQSGYPETQSGDTRKVRNASSSPEWLAAVGRTLSQNSSKTMEQCSVSLLADNPHKDGVIVLGAGHCIDHWAAASGGFEVGKHSVNFITNTGKTIVRQLDQILKAETHQGDYFIGKLDRAIANSDIQPLLPSPYHYSDLVKFPYKTAAYIAGYSADKGIGQQGKVLTYGDCNRLAGGASGMKKAHGCYSYSGASGGPIVATIDFSNNEPQLNPYIAMGCGKEACKNEWEDFSDEEIFVDFFQFDYPWMKRAEYTFWFGIIVGARAGDDASKTLFTEASHFTRTLDKILATH